MRAWMSVCAYVYVCTCVCAFLPAGLPARMSTYRYDDGHFYPCSPDAAPETVGSGAGAGYTVNVGWNQHRMGDAEYLATWNHVLMPIARAFAPDLVLVSAGYDAARGDPLVGAVPAHVFA